METELESVRRLALYHALGRENAGSSASCRDSVCGDSVALPSRITVEEEVKLLGMTSIGRFTLAACSKMAAVVDEVDAAKTSYAALLRYFGEEDNTSIQPNDMFHIISTFTNDFDSSLSVVMKEEKELQREEKRKARKRALVLPPIADENESSTSSNSNGSVRKRLASGMSGVLNELRKTPNLKWRRRKHVP